MAFTGQFHPETDLHNAVFYGDQCPYTEIKDGRSKFVVNLSQIIKFLQLWQEKMPKTAIYYCVKTNSDPNILKVIAHYGHGAHCNSMQEIEKALAAGIPADKVMYAFVYKSEEDMKKASKLGITLLVTNCVEQIEAISKYIPNARVLLRVKGTPPPVSKNDYRFTCLPQEVPVVASTAARLGVKIIGLSFYTECMIFHNDTARHQKIMLQTKDIMKCLISHGFEMKILNIGGGFSNGKNAEVFEKTASLIDSAFSDLTQDFPNLYLVAEPGTFMVRDAVDVYANVIAKRRAKDVVTGDEMIHYTLNQSRFGGFVFPSTLTLIFNEEFLSSDKPCYKSMFWGCCSPSFDIISEDLYIPELQVGDWICVKDTGAYNQEFQTQAHSFPILPPIYTTQAKHRSLFQSFLDTKLFDEIEFNSSSKQVFSNSK